MQDESPLIPLDVVNWLLRQYNIPSQTPITSLKQCSSSLFVMLCKRMFEGGDSLSFVDPQSSEGKLANVTQIIDFLSTMLPPDTLRGISAAEVVALNEDHISRLIKVFLEIACFALPDANEANGTEEEKQSGMSASSADSAMKTQELVHSWKEGIVPPGTKLTHEIGALSRRIQALDAATGPRHRPQRHIARRPRGPPIVPHYLIAHPRLIDPAARDAKILAQRNHRYIESLEQEVNRAVIANTNAAEVEMRRRVKEQAERHKRDKREVERWAREEDEKFRAAYKALVDSACSEARHSTMAMAMATAADGSGGKRRRGASFTTGKARERIREAAAAVPAQQRLAKEFSRAYRQLMKDEAAQYVQALGGWRASEFWY